MPTALWGTTDQVAKRFNARDLARSSGHSGMGTTQAGNPMQFACREATLSEVATREAFSHMNEGAEQLAAGLSHAIAVPVLPWHVIRVDAIVEFICAPETLLDGASASTAHHPALKGAVHLGLSNRGCLIAPFHNMMRVSPVTTSGQIDRLVVAFASVLSELNGDAHA